MYCRLNTNPFAIPYDHNRVQLQREGDNAARSDYINASYIWAHDHEEDVPAWIVAQGPLDRTVADFWQMVS